MRTWWSRCLSTFALAAAATVAAGQQLPPAGCNAAPSCRGNSYSVLTGNAGGHVLMSVGVAWDPGFHVGLVGTPNPPSGTENGDQRFQLHAPPLLPRPALEAPPPAPQPLTLPPPDSDRLESDRPSVPPDRN